jgi:hypothetical protein
VGKWVPKFSAGFDNMIWNIHAVDGGGLLLELRDSPTEYIAYALMDNELSDIRNIRPDGIPWFSQVVYCGFRFLLVQEYDSELNPDHTNLHCFSLNSGKKLWVHEGLQFIFPAETGFACRRNDKVFLINRSSGMKMNSGEMVPAGSEPLDLPTHYIEGGDDFEVVASYIRNKMGVDPVRAIDYYEDRETVIFSYYKQSVSDMLSLELLAMDKEGKALLFDVLDTGLNGIADPPFLFYRQNLIFVKEKRHFFVYALASKKV